MSAIIDVIAREILDSRGNPTVEVELLTEEVVDEPAELDERQVLHETEQRRSALPRRRVRRPGPGSRGA